MRRVEIHIPILHSIKGNLLRCGYNILQIIDFIKVDTQIFTTKQRIQSICYLVISKQEVARGAITHSCELYKTIAKKKQ